MRKHHSRHWVVRALAGLTGSAIALVGLSFSETVPVHADGSAAFWLAQPNGSVTAEGGAPDFGSTSTTPASPVVSLVPAPDSRGYWLAEADGDVQAFGRAGSYGHISGAPTSPIVGMAPTPDGHGYWLVASDGDVYTFGQARFFGSAGDVHSDSPIVGMTATPDGGGYWLVTAGGGVFTYGDARYSGSAGDVRLSSPITGMARTADGHGYWLVAADGGVFSYGDAGYFGSGAGSPELSGPGSATVEELVATPDSRGYRLVDGRGVVESFGDATGNGTLPPFGVVEGTGPSPQYAPAPDPVESHAEQFALSQVGKPYSYGAAGPGAYDCSGLVYRSYAEAGVSLPRTAAEQYGAGAHVALADLQPGDLMFWASDNSDPSTIYHVGIYVGHGRVVNATHTGSTVQVMPVSELGPSYPEATRP